MSSNAPTYILEHLATFSVDEDNDLLYPADGMRRLLAMEKNNGIWTQKMLMRLERRMIHIMDHENGDVVECFPADIVREPTAFTSNDPAEIYNNILIYIVGNGMSSSEMHIFQCVNVRARDVVEDLKAFMNDYPVQNRFKSNHSPHHPRHGRRQHEIEDDEDEIKISDLSPFQESSSKIRSAAAAATVESSSNRFSETSSTSSDKYEKDVAILNRCFDDIEKFIARLQNAAAASRELDKRQKSRKSKRRDLGDGMLSVRAKAPPEREFIDIFQKFKLSFNLLAKLKAHIHDPNAPELVHFLFTPLALIVDASHESHYGPNLPGKVVSPLLSPGAVDLLLNCLTSKENELWHSLGEAWFIPSDAWKDYVSPYKPVFMDGYTTTISNDLGGGRRSGSNGKRRSHREEEEGGSPPEEEEYHPPPSPNYRLIEEEFQSQQNLFAKDLMARGAKMVQVTYPRSANNEKELTVVRGEFLEVVDDTKKWWKTRNITGQLGHVPNTIITPKSFRDTPEPPNVPPQTNTMKADWIQKERRGRNGAFRYF
ncbi:epidermal growth factor receptor kinase substrate 8 isoform X2 [Lepeophtheirus salmonis]|nr:epidermal growth factor receptor kinase substrate 8-like isoform X2 [Lepeophtheirus salmonis]